MDTTFDGYSWKILGCHNNIAQKDTLAGTMHQMHAHWWNCDYYVATLAKNRVSGKPGWYIVTCEHLQW